MDTKKKTEKRPVIQSRYHPQKDGRPAPGKISQCPEAGCDSQECIIIKNGWRERKTGPLTWLALRVCRVHNGGVFTVYNIGMLPKKRRSFFDGKDQFTDAIVDGAEGKKWPEEAKGGASTFKTQKRHIQFWCELIGVEPGQSIDCRRIAALCLNVSTMRLCAAANRIRAGPTWNCRARVVAELLGNLGKIKFSSILSRGHALNFWGRSTIDRQIKLLSLDFSTT